MKKYLVPSPPIEFPNSLIGRIPLPRLTQTSRNNIIRKYICQSLSKRWKVNWGGKLLTIHDKTRWLGFYLDPFLNWRAHVKIRVQQGLWRQQKVARFMQRWGINRKLARTVAWSTSMATAAYGIEAIWEGQPWIVQSFHKLTARIGRDVSGTFASTMGRQ
jgi:hypothetical protein